MPTIYVLVQKKIKKNIHIPLNLSFPIKWGARGYKSQGHSFYFSDEPLPWTDQDTIDYIGTHLHLSAGVVDNLNKDENNYIDMVLKLKNNGESVVQKGTWKLYFFK